MPTQIEPMAAYLAATSLCDHKNPAIVKLASEITADFDAAEDKAKAIFYYVRDHIRFSLAYSRSKASQTLRRKYGECGSKTNAQIALLRAAGIPARLHWVKAQSTVLEHLVAGFVYRNMPSIASHFWCECYLHDKWIACETLLDQPLYRGMLSRGWLTHEQIPTIDWDGKSDLILLRPWIDQDCGTIPSIDDALAELQSSEEGMPPPWLEWLIAPFFYPLNLRVSDAIRQPA